MFRKLKSLVASAIASTMGMSFKAVDSTPKRASQRVVPLFRKPVRYRQARRLASKR